jgi:DNA polymerase III delta prime subunit
MHHKQYKGKRMKELWVEKYRPKKVEDYVFRDTAQRKQVESWIKEGSIPHLLLSGAAGIGKTTLARVLCNELNIEEFDVLEINASRENNVETVRDKIINFVQMIPFGPFKVVLLDEADYLTPNAQAILRGVMETYSNHSRFILTCNYPNRIIPALHSRCQGYHVERTDQTEFTARVATILVTEDIEFDLDTLDTYVKSTYPDLRKCINLVQQNVNEDSILSAPTSGDSGGADYKIAMVELFKKGKIQEARKLLCGKARPEEMEDIYRWMYDNLELFGDSDEKKDQALLVIKQGLVDHTLIADAEINLAATLVKLARLQ